MHGPAGIGKTFAVATVLRRFAQIMQGSMPGNQIEESKETEAEGNTANRDKKKNDDGDKEIFKPLTCAYYDDIARAPNQILVRFGECSYFAQCVVIITFAIFFFAPRSYVFVK